MRNILVAILGFLVMILMFLAGITVVGIFLKELFV
jgi:hypothetical protein